MVGAGGSQSEKGSHPPSIDCPNLSCKHYGPKCPARGVENRCFRSPLHSGGWSSLGSWFLWVSLYQWWSNGAFLLPLHPDWSSLGTWFQWVSFYPLVKGHMSEPGSQAGPASQVCLGSGEQKWPIPLPFEAL